MIYGSENLEKITVSACDNGFIVEMYIPIDYDKNMHMMDLMTDKIIASQNKIAGDDYKNVNEVPLPPQKSNYTFVCKDEKEVSQILQDFFKRTKK